MPNTEGFDSSIFQKVVRFFQLTLKYGSTSVIATLVDFGTFGLFHPIIGSIYSTIIGRSIGAIIAFLLHRQWVFKAAKTTLTKRLILKYLAAVLLGMGLNVLGVWFLNHLLLINAWTSRVVTAISVWGLIFLFNKHVVFKEQILNLQDFTDTEMESDLLVTTTSNTEG
jgi:putative flippase GtrA